MLKLRSFIKEICQCNANPKSIKNLRKLSSLLDPHKKSFNVIENHHRLIPPKTQKLCNRKFFQQSSKVSYSTIETESTELDSNLYEHVCEETLHSLAEFFEEFVEANAKFAKADVNYSGGVLTVDLGESGTYVINRQSPNKQIWLSSPVSGPKRYDYIVDKDCWIYKHDGMTLHSLLQEELSNILGRKVKLEKCSHS